MAASVVNDTARAPLATINISHRSSLPSPLSSRKQLCAPPLLLSLPTSFFPCHRYHHHLPGGATCHQSFFVALINLGSSTLSSHHLLRPRSATLIAVWSATPPLVSQALLIQLSCPLSYHKEVLDFSSSFPAPSHDAVFTKALGFSSTFPTPLHEVLLTKTPRASHPPSLSPPVAPLEQRRLALFTAATSAI